MSLSMAARVLNKGSILEDLNQSAASFMEKSELVKENENDIKIQVDSCDSIDHTEGLDQHTIANRGKNADQEAPKTYTGIDLETIDSIEQQLYNCIRCDEGGKVLICNADLCPLAVHERCLGFSVTLDDKGNFCCPACSYNKARAEFLEANKNVEMTKKALCLFMRTGNVEGRVIEHQRLAEPSTVCNSENIPCNVKGTTPANKALIAILTKEKLEKAKVEETIQKNAMTDKEHISSNKPRKKQGAAKRSSNPALPNSKRKKLFWSVEEEDILKEGVWKFSSKEMKNIPWKRILEFGCNVFDSTRNSVDLKDKWRRMTKEKGQEEEDRENVN